MLTILITINAIIMAVIITFFVVSSALWHMSDIGRLSVTEPKLAAWIRWIPIVLSWGVIVALWSGVVGQWLICHGALLIFTLVVSGVYICKAVLHWIRARQDQ